MIPHVKDNKVIKKKCASLEHICACILHIYWVSQKSSFRFFCNILRKSRNKLFGQPSPIQSLKLNNHHCKRVQNAVLGYSLKNDKMVSVRFQSKPFNITVIQVYAPTSNAEEAEVEWLYDNLQDFLELTHQKKKKKKRCPFHHRGLECKSRKSRDTWSNRQVWAWSTK